MTTTPRTASGRGDKPASILVDAAQRPRSLDECHRCALFYDATQPVPGAGSPHAKLMLVGEQPGDSEDRAGLPFVGAAGRLLDSILAEVGIERPTIYITNAVKHFKWELRGKRRLHKTPVQREVEACRYWLDSELTRIQPHVVVALGATALRAVLNDPHARLNAYMHEPTRRGDAVILATWHPSYVLRAPSATAREDARAQLSATLRDARALLSRRKE